MTAMTLENALTVVAYYQNWGHKGGWMTPHDEEILNSAHEVIERAAKIVLSFEYARRGWTE